MQLHTVLQLETDTGPVRQLPLTLPPGSTLADVLVLLEIDYPLDSLLLVINGGWANLDQLLASGDQISLIPAISGG